MQYDSYEQKIQKIARLIKPIFKHLIKITIAISLVLLTVATLLATKGIITVNAAPNYSSEIYYGDELKYSASAFLSDVEYEYSEADKEAWTKEFPKDPGTYKVRAVAEATFGYRYGEASIFTIKPRPVTIEIESDTVRYGDSPVAVGGLLNGDTLAEVDFWYNEDKTVTKVDVDSVKIVDTNGNDITPRYRISSKESGIKFTKRPFTIAVETVSRVYNGAALSSEEYSTYGTLAEGDRLDVSFSAEITEVGSVENVAQYKIFNEKDVDVTELYDITYRSGYLTVLKRHVSYQTGSVSVVYDGSFHESQECELTSETELVEGHTLKTENWGGLKLSGMIENTADYCIVDGEGNDVTSNYEISIEWGKIVVSQRPITLQTLTYNDYYDDQTHAAEEYLILGEYGLAENQRIEVSGWQSIHEVGSLENSIAYAIIDEENNDVTEQYSITPDFGELVVKPRPIVVVTPSKSWIYDGKSYVYNTLTVDTSRGYDLCEGHAFEKYAWSIFCDAAPEEENIVLFNIIKDKLYDVGANYDITYDYGTVTVQKRPITVKTYGVNKVYDGNVFTNDKVYVDTTGGKLGLCDYHDFMVTYPVPEFKNVISSAKNEIDFEIIGDGRVVTDNYDITCEYGTVNITPRNITVKTNGYTGVYDGLEHWDDAVSIDTARSPYKLCAEHSFFVQSYPVFKDVVSAAENKVKFIIVSGENNENVTDNYNITYQYGTFTISKRIVRLQTKAQSWV